MNPSNLMTIPASGTQNVTQDPQSAGTSNGAGTAARSVQPGTAQAALDVQSGGVPLKGTALSTINLPATSSSTAVAAPANSDTRADNPLVVGFSVILFLIAIAVIAAVFIPAKNTTD